MIAMKNAVGIQSAILAHAPTLIIHIHRTIEFYGMQDLKCWMMRKNKMKSMLEAFGGPCTILILVFML